MAAQAKRIAVLNSVVARYQNQMPGNDGFYKNTKRIKNNENITRYSAASLESRRPICLDMSPGQANAHYKGTAHAKDTVGVAETHRKAKGTEGLITWSTGFDTKLSFFVGQTPNQPFPQFQPSSLQKVSNSQPTDRNSRMAIPVPLTQGAATNISPSTMTEPVPPVVNALPAQILINRETKRLTNQPCERRQLTSNVIGENINRFENGLESTANRNTVTKDNSFKQMKNSSMHGKRALKAVFDGVDFSSSFERGLSMKDINSIINKFQNIETDAKLGRGDGFTSRGKTLVGSSYASSRTLLEMREGRVDGLSGEAKEMIVREAECGLKEPKPLRLTETRRIIWLCRGHLGTPQLRRRAISEPLGA